MKENNQKNKRVCVSRGEVIGIGKLKVFPSVNFAYEIPILSFMVIKTSEKYVSICVQLFIEGSGDTADEAQKAMQASCYSFLQINFSHEYCRENAWENLKNLFKSNELNNELWNAYREIQLILAENGVCTDIKIRMKRRIEDLEKQIVELTVNKEKEKEDNDFFYLEIVKYEEAYAA